MLANGLQEYIKRLFTVIKLTSFQGYTDDLTYARNKCNTFHKQTDGQKSSITSTDAENSFDKIQHPFMIRAPAD